MPTTATLQADGRFTPGSPAELRTDPEHGLTAAEVERRRQQYGPNTLAERQQSVLLRIFGYFWGPIPWMIEVAAILSAIVRHWPEFGIIITMLLVNAGVRFWQEYQADNAIAQLKRRLALTARVLRDGAWHTVPASELVPGDVLDVRLGNIIPADVELLKGQYLSVDQSALTGESLPVEKTVGDTAYSGSVARQGEMRAVVTATGMQTYFGKTASLVETAKTTSHFQRAVLRIGNFLIFVTIGLVAVILGVAAVRHDPLLEVVQFALILTVAAIPVALPAVLSVTMAVGAERLARLKAIVSRLVAIEEMAGIDILCSDKTGTLTENRLSLGPLTPIEAPDENELVVAAALASDRSADDPIDAAVLRGLSDSDALDDYVQLSFQPYDPVSKRTVAEVEHGDEWIEVSKGAPQVILSLVDADAPTRSRVERRVGELATDGYRALGVARRRVGREWELLGLLSLFDPPRDDSAATVDALQAMGIDIKMVTGDHLAIARQIAQRLHLGKHVLPADEVLAGDLSPEDRRAVEQADGYAQVFPEHKFGIVRALQTENHIVGMTGDGVNDAPALKQADVGIAVTGATDAARAAADLVLTEAGLSVIARAVEEARRIFSRMTAYATYRIAETVRILLFMTLAIVAFNFYPVTAVMIILLALLNDFPIMMIAYDNASAEARPVRWKMREVLSIASLLGTLGVISSFGLFWIAETQFHIPRDTIQTLIFLKLLVAGHLTIYLTRNRGAIWARPFPSWKLFVTTETTQAVGTLAAVYGWLVAPIGWRAALLVWAYALAWFGINSAAKIVAFRVLDRHAPVSAPVRHRSWDPSLPSGDALRASA